MKDIKESMYAHPRDEKGGFIFEAKEVFKDEDDSNVSLRIQLEDLERKVKNLGEQVARMGKTISTLSDNVRALAAVQRQQGIEIDKKVERSDGAGW